MDGARRGASTEGALRELRSAHGELAALMAQRVEAQAEAVARLSASITAALGERPTGPQVKQLIREAVGSPAALRELQLRLAALEGGGRPHVEYGTGYGRLPPGAVDARHMGGQPGGGRSTGGGVAPSKGDARRRTQGVLADSDEEVESP